MRPIVMQVLNMVVYKAVALAVCTIVIHLLWNLLMPAILGLPAITLLQALGVYVLFSFLFKS